MREELKRLANRYKNREPGLLGARQSYAVLCPLVEQEDGLHLLFEVRAANLRQGGEVCFPGGRMEAGERVSDCALRETEEELSIPRQEVTILGLPDFICSQRGFLLRPVLGLVSPQGFAALKPAPAEVAEAFTVPLAFFQQTSPELWRYELTPQVPEDFPYGSVGIPRDYPWSRGQTEVPIWYYQGRAIWGMTARLVRDLVQGETGHPISEQTKLL